MRDGAKTDGMPTFELLEEVPTRIFILKSASKSTLLMDGLHHKNTTDIKQREQISFVKIFII